MAKQKTFLVLITVTKTITKRVKAFNERQAAFDTRVQLDKSGGGSLKFDAEDIKNIEASEIETTYQAAAQ
jgi:hypothetical protein